MNVRAASETQPSEPGWWQASDGKWYPPESRPQTGWASPAPTVKKRRRWPWILGAVVIVFGVIMGSCVAIIGSAANELNKEQQSHAISKAQFDAVPLGITHGQLSDRLGKTPEDSQEFVQKGVLTEQDVNSSCVYYNKTGETFGSSRFQFCFEGDSLRSKNAY